MSKQNPIEIISAIALEPGKFYILNVKGTQGMPKETIVYQMRSMRDYLQANDLNCLFVLDPLEIVTAEVTQAEFNKKVEEKHE